MAAELIPSSLPESLDTLETELARNQALRDAVTAAERSVLARLFALFQSVRRRSVRIVGASATLLAATAFASPGPARAAGPAPHDVSGACRIHGPLQSGGLVGIDWFIRVGAPGNIASGDSIPRSGEFQIYGWGQDRSRTGAAQAVCLIVDGKVEGRATSLYGEPRPDVAKVLKNPTLSASGYLIKIPQGVFPSGAHRISVATVSSDGSLTQSSVVRTITVR